MAEITPRRTYDSRIRSGDPIVGLCFGAYRVVSEESPSYVRPDGRLVRRYVCECSCGARMLVTAGSIKHKTPLSCSKCRGKDAEPGFFLTPGVRFGSMDVLREMTDGWSCKCACGASVVISRVELQQVSRVWCPACAARIQQDQIAARAVSYLHNNYFQHAQKRGRAFHLSESELGALVTAACFYCGVASSNVYTDRQTGETFPYNGVDRVDATKDYEASNVVPACRHCNFAKQRLSKDDFLDLVRRIATHLNLCRVEGYNG